jgi:hypothetical protein
MFMNSLLCNSALGRQEKTLPVLTHRIGTMYRKKYISSRKARFVEAFPEICQLHIEVRVKQTRAEVDLPYRVYTLENPPDEIINCNSINCAEGGILIYSILKEMIRNRLTSMESKEICNGEVVPAQSKIRGTCLKSFRIKIAMTYQSSEENREGFRIIQEL